MQFLCRQVACISEIFKVAILCCKGKCSQVFKDSLCCNNIRAESYHALCLCNNVHYLISLKAVSDGDGGTCTDCNV